MDVDRPSWGSTLLKNHDENKTYILVKLSESFSNAIQEYSAAQNQHHLQQQQIGATPNSASIGCQPNAVNSTSNTTSNNKNNNYNSNTKNHHNNSHLYNNHHHNNNNHLHQNGSITTSASTTNHKRPKLQHHNSFSSNDNNVISNNHAINSVNNQRNNNNINNDGTNNQPIQEAPTIRFHGTRGAIRFPNGKSYDFSIEQSDNSVECIKQTKNKWESVGKMAYCLHVKGKDDVYQRTRTKMEAAEQEKRKYCTKLLDSPENNTSTNHTTIKSTRLLDTSDRTTTTKSSTSSSNNTSNNNHNHHNNHHTNNHHIKNTNHINNHNHQNQRHNNHHNSHNNNYNQSSNNNNHHHHTSNNNNSTNTNNNSSNHNSITTNANNINATSASTASSSSSSSFSSSTSSSSALNSNSKSSLLLSTSSSILSKYPDITDVKQLKKYKADFDKDFKEYQNLHGYLHRIEERFKKLRELLKQSVEGSAEWESAKEQIFNEYERIKGDSNFHRARSKYKQLCNKLIHIKEKIFQFKRQQRDKFNKKRKR